MTTIRPASRPHATLDLEPPSTRAWVTRARCGPGSGINPDLFFPTVSGRAAELQRQEAKTVCRLCPVRNECLEEAMDEEGPAVWAKRDGIRGGMDEKDRALEAKRRGIKPELKPCGSRAAYQRHRNAMEEPCAECKDANRVYNNKRETIRIARGDASWQVRLQANRERAS